MLLPLYHNSNIKHSVLIFDNNGNHSARFHGEDIALITDYVSDIISAIIDNNRVDVLGDTILIDNAERKNRIFCCHYKISNLTNDYTKIPGTFREKENLVVIKSQTGTPICIYACDEVGYEVLDDFPKTTKILVDDKFIYVHRANFNIIETKLMNDK